MIHRSTNQHEPDRPLDFDGERQRMVDVLIERGISDERVLDAMGSVRREDFIGESEREAAYADRPLSIALGQTISQPYIVAVMAEAAEIGPNDRVAEIGTGSGYGAAVLAKLAAWVWTVERHEPLADEARRRLGEQGVRNVTVVHGDGSHGLPAAAPFDAIVVTASPERIPPALIGQLGEGGRLIIPVGPEHEVQALTCIRRQGREVTLEQLGAVRFVPLIAEE